MKVTATTSFNKDISSITDAQLARRIESIIRKLEAAQTLTEISGIKKMAGAQNAYRIRIGDYRLGFFLISKTIQLTIFAHRKEIYKNFP
jgi:mRNA interferase RelE/StbE